MSQTNEKTTLLVRNAFLCALIVLMSYTPLGYLTIGPFSVTFLTVPVLIGAITLGSTSGALLGLVFGLTSFINAARGASAMGLVLFQISPLNTFILSVVPRVLEGYLCGLLFEIINRNKDNKLWKVTLASLSCPVLNTALYMSSLVLLFGNTDYILNLRAGKNVFSFVVGMVGIQAVVEAVICTLVGSAVCVSIMKYFKTKN